MLEIKNLNISTASGRMLIKDLNFAINPGDKIAIIGEEGNGKTTLLKEILAILKSENNGIQPAYMPQNYEDILDPKNRQWKFYALAKTMF